MYFHGPAYQVLDRVWRDDGIVGRLARELPADHEPASRPTEFVPRLIELCFQTAGVWELGHVRTDGAADAVERVARFAGAEEARPSVGGREPARRRRRRRRRRGRRGRARAGAARGLSHDRAAGRRRGGTRSRRSAPRWPRAEVPAMQRAFSRLAIVNRGEPAMRVIHAVRELNEQRAEAIRLIALYTESRARRHVRPSRRRGGLPGPEPGRRGRRRNAASPTWTTARWSAR